MIRYLAFYSVNQREKSPNEKLSFKEENIPDTPG